MKQTKNTTSGITPSDAWVGLGLMPFRVWRDLPDGQRPPRMWHELRPDQRGMLAGLAGPVIGQHGPATRGRLNLIRARLIEALRATWQRIEKGGHGHPLAHLYVEDETERKKWQRLDLTLQGPPFGGNSLLDELIEGIGAQGNLVQTLRARRDAIDAELARLGGDDDLGDAA